MRLGRALWISLNPSDRLFFFVRKLWSYFLRRALELTRDLAKLCAGTCLPRMLHKCPGVIYEKLLQFTMHSHFQNHRDHSVSVGPCFATTIAMFIMVTISILVVVILQATDFRGENPKGAGDARHGAASGRIPRRLDDRYLQRPG